MSQTGKLSFTLNDQTVTASSDETIWEVAKREGIDIPHLCHRPKPGYAPDGNCRACMVEIDGERTLAASCIRKPTQDMIVKTTTQRAKKARAMIIELLLSDQPTHDKAPDQASHFWDMAAAHQLTQSRFPNQTLSNKTFLTPQWQSNLMHASIATCVNELVVMFK